MYSETENLTFFTISILSPTTVVEQKGIPTVRVHVILEKIVFAQISRYRQLAVVQSTAIQYRYSVTIERQALALSTHLDGGRPCDGAGQSGALLVADSEGEHGLAHAQAGHRVHVHTAALLHPRYSHQLVLVCKRHYLLKKNTVRKGLPKAKSRHVTRLPYLHKFSRAFLTSQNPHNYTSGHLMMRVRTKE
jgi:hypothetical protein